MKLFVVLVVTLSLALYSFRGEHEDTDVLRPADVTRIMFNSELDSLINDLDQITNPKIFHSLDITTELDQQRLRFKRIEFLLYYLDPQHFNTAINGAPLPKVMKKVPDLQIIEPKGFQRIEELVAELPDSEEELISTLAELKQGLEQYRFRFIQDQFIDPVIFESIRFGVLRLQTMGITGFDLPVEAKKMNREVEASLDGMERVLQSYEDYFSTDSRLELQKLFDQGRSLAKTPFEEFDRIKFIREVGDPLLELTLEVQRSLFIELPAQRIINYRSALNYEAKGLFEEEFLNPAYFAEHDLYDERKVQLGKLLFYDPILSKNNKRACASCHNPEKGFSDGNKTSLNLDKGSFGLRNAPTVYNSVFAERYFHDLRVDRLAFQMDHVVLNENEFNTDYNEIATKLMSSDEYVLLFNDAYGAEGVSKNTITNAVTNYVASLKSFNSEFDKYMRGELPSIDTNVYQGFNLFMGKAGCATCHFPPTFSGLVPPVYQESESEVLGVPDHKDKPHQLDRDQGRYMNRILKEQGEFYKFSFKTPTVRNIERTAPYMHNGAYETLEEVIDFYDAGGGIGLGFEVPYQTLPSDSLGLDDVEKKQLVSFMKSLNDFSAFTGKPQSLPNFGDEALNKRKIGGEY